MDRMCQTFSTGKSTDCAEISEHRDMDSIVNPANLS